MQLNELPSTCFGLPVFQAALAIRPLDGLAIVIYLLAILGMGVYFSRRMKTTENYFLGGRSFPGWAVGLSLFGTNISSITFLALPAAAFKGTWELNTQNAVLPIAAIFAVVVIIPFFRRAGLVSAFEYLEDRYGSVPRLYAAISFIVLQIARVALILYLIAIPASAIFDVPIETVIIVGGVVIGLYTILGGIEAVIWTDVIQTLVLIVGGILCVGAVVLELPGGVSDVIEAGVEGGKFNVGSWKFDWHEKNVYVLVLWGLTGYVKTFCADQNVVQRYAASASTREARKATVIWALLSVPTWYFFMFLGTCLFVYYNQFPDPEVAAIPRDESERVLPYFVLNEIPAGIAGIILAAVLAAAMSTMDSGVNAMATVTVIDILKRYSTRERSDAFYLKTARWLSGFYTCAVIGCAIWYLDLEKDSIAHLSIVVGALFGGCVGGMFLVGFFTTRVDNRSAVIAMAIAILVNVYFVLDNFNKIPEQLSLSVYSYYVVILVNIVFAVFAYGIALIRGKPPKDIDRLTVWTTARRAGS